jgi:hypothetical protein
MRESLKNDLSPGLKAASLQKIPNYSGNLDPESSKYWADWLPPKKQEAAGACLIGRVRVASNVPDSVVV